MKNIKLIGLFLIAIIGLQGCDQDDDLVFTAVPPAEGASFSNTFLDEYVLTPATSGNLAERFTWNDVFFDTPTPTNYELQRSISGDFDEAELVVGSTDGNEIAVSVGTMLGYAEEAGLDNDPSTENPNTGQVYFRLRAFPGDASSSVETFSDVQALTVVLPEESLGGGAFEIASWGVVGSGYNNWGAYADGFFYTTGTPNVFVSYVTLFDGEIKFRENNDWTNNFGDTGADGTLDAGGDNIAVSAGTYKITLDIAGGTYIIEPYSWGVVGSAYNDWGATPDGKFYYDHTTDTFKVGIKLMDGEMKVRFNNDWAVNFGDTGADGTLDAGGDNIPVTEGYYAITIDLNNNTYTVEAADLWGVVGSGYNDWGATPDFTFTQVNEGVWIAEVVPLLDGEIKFRINDDWGVNVGDTGADGTLDAGGDNIAVSAGNARIWLDITNNTYTINQ
jgi:hypothetical protein